jgi:hypothetical protein
MKYKGIIALYWTMTALPLWGALDHSFLTFRSQGVNGARALVGWQQLRTDLFSGYCSGNISCSLSYTHSFDHEALNAYFFGANQLVFSGSRVPDRAPSDILADYFGLPTDFKSVVCFKPTISNIIVDFDWYWALHYWCPGLYVRVMSPLVHSRWDLKAQEKVLSAGELNYPAGYMGTSRIDRDQLPAQVLQVLCGNVPAVGDLDTPFAFGRWCGKQTTTKLSDIFIGLGYAALDEERYQLALDVHTVVPTGTRSCASCLFEPQIGNGHHWGLGVGCIGYYNLWSDCDGDRCLAAYCDIHIQHLFGSVQQRSYDLCANGAGSRYMLLEDMGNPVGGILSFGGTEETTELATKQYHGRLFHAINKTTFASKIKINVQADLAFKLAFQWHCWEGDIGYDLWIRSREKLVCREWLLPNHYAIKGDAQLYGYNLNIPEAGDIFVPLNATQSQATIHAGQGTGNANLTFINTNADNAAEAYVNIDEALVQSTAQGLEGTGVDVIGLVNGSNQALLLNDSAINPCSGLSPRALTNKLFGHVAYTWYERCGAIPYLGIGGEVEWAAKTNGVKTAASQYGIWIKGGITY